MKKYLLLILFLFAPIFVSAQSLDSISYPIEQLGNCESKEACRVYCDKFENLESCLNFSKENKLLSSCEITTNSRRLLDAFKNGLKLAFCQSKSECREYCSRPENLKQCVDFVEASGFLSHEEALLIKKTGGIGPGNCQNKEACKEYCSDEKHLDDCLKFALDNGFITPAQAVTAINARDLADKGGPGGCMGLKECAKYCSDINNLDNCIKFGQKTGLIQGKEAEEIEQFAKDGGPGECKTREQCKTYCEDTNNSQECLSFLIEKDYLSKEAVEAIEKELKNAEELINRQLEQFKGRYNDNLKMQKDQEKMRQEFGKILAPYMDLIEKYKNKH